VDERNSPVPLLRVAIFSIARTTSPELRCRCRLPSSPPVACVVALVMFIVPCTSPWCFSRMELSIPAHFSPTLASPPPFAAARRRLHSFVAVGSRSDKSDQIYPVSILVNPSRAV
jgi:hypothetical protein